MRGARRIGVRLLVEAQHHINEQCQNEDGDDRDHNQKQVVEIMHVRRDGRDGLQHAELAGTAMALRQCRRGENAESGEGRKGTHHGLEGQPSERNTGFWEANSRNDY